MAAVDPAVVEAPSMALPGLARALISAGKLGQKSAEDISRKAQANRTSFIAELTGSGAVSASDLAHTMSTAFGAPLLDLDADRPAAAAQEPAGPQDLPGLPRGGAEQAQQPPDRRHRRPIGPAGGRKNQVRHPDGRGLDHCRIRQALQDGGSRDCQRHRGDGQHHRRRFRVRRIHHGVVDHRGHGGRAVRSRGRAGRQVPAQDAARCLQHAGVRPALRALRAQLPRALSRRRRTARDRLAARSHQGQAGLAHQGHLAHGHLRKARAAGRQDEAQDRSRPRDRFPGLHPAHAVRRKDRDPYPGSQQRPAGRGRAGLRARGKRAPAGRREQALWHGAGDRARPARARPFRSTPA